MIIVICILLFYIFNNNTNIRRIKALTMFHISLIGINKALVNNANETKERGVSIGLHHQIVPNIKKQLQSRSLFDIIKRYIFFDNNLDFVPHTEHNVITKWTSYPFILLSNIAGNYYPISRDKFTTEAQYIELMKDYDFNFFTTFDDFSNNDPVKLITKIVTEYIGFDMFNPYIVNDITFLEIDTSELAKYEMRKGYSNLHTKTIFKLNIILLSLIIVK